MSNSGTSISWEAIGITMLIWLPVFLATIWVLRKKKMPAWKYRLVVSLLAATGLAPSAFPIHASLTVIPAVTALVVLEHMDSTALWFAGLLGVVPILVTTAIMFVGWNLFFPKKEAIQPSVPTRRNGT